MIAFKVTCCDLKIGFCAVNKTEKKHPPHSGSSEGKDAEERLMFRYRWPIALCAALLLQSRLLCICDAFLITGEVK